MSRRVGTAGPARRNWAAGLACGICLACNPATILFLATMLAPALLVATFEPHPDRTRARGVLAAGLAATAGPCIRLWGDGPPSMAATLDRMAHPAMLAGAWLAASIAWLGSELMTLAAWAWLARRDRLRMARLDAEIAGLEAEWGAADATPR